MSNGDHVSSLWPLREVFFKSLTRWPIDSLGRASCALIERLGFVRGSHEEVTAALLHWHRDRGARMRACLPPKVPPTPPPVTHEPNQIVFTRDGDIWIMDQTGAHQKPMTVGPDTDSGPKLSPGGNQVVFQRTGSTQPPARHRLSSGS